MAKSYYGAFARIVTSQDQVDPIVEPIQELLEITRSPGNVLRGIVRSTYPETSAGPRHQLP